MLKKDFNKKLILKIFCVVIMLVVGAVVFCGCNDNENIQPETSTTALADIDSDSDILSGDSTFLVVIVNESNEIVLPLLADFKIYSHNLILTSLSVDAVVSDGRTYGEIYAYGGINLLKSCVEETRNIDIDRFVVINKSGFSKLTELMGEVTLYVEEDYTYDSSDKTYEVSKGENEMASDMLYTYIALIASHNSGELKATELICTIINTYLENINITDYEKLFGEVTNCFTTDLNISDFYTAKSDIEHLISDGFACILSNNVDD